MGTWRAAQLGGMRRQCLSGSRAFYDYDPRIIAGRCLVASAVENSQTRTRRDACRLGEEKRGGTMRQKRSVRLRAASAEWRNAELREWKFFYTTLHLHLQIRVYGQKRISDPCSILRK